MRKLLLLKIFICLFAPLLCWAEEASIYTFFNPKNVGDVSHIKGVVTALKSQLAQQDTQTAEESFSVTEGDRLGKRIQADCEKNRKIILLAMKEEGINFIAHLPSHKESCQLLTCHLSHQLSSQHTQLLGKADICVVPEFALDTTFKEKAAKTKTLLVPTQGIAHNLTVQTIEKAYQEQKSQLPQTPPYLVFVLAGDAPDPTGKTHYFTVQEAEQLAKVLANSASHHSYPVIVFNNHRTGQHDPKTGKEIPGVHEGKMDPVTLKFVTTLTSLLGKERVTLYDFQRGQPNPYRAVLGGLKEAGGLLCLPGESISMISEALDVIPKQVAVYENGSMTSSHKAYFDQVLNNKSALPLTQALENSALPFPAPPSAAPQTTADFIAEKILLKLKTP